MLFFFFWFFFFCVIFFVFFFFPLFLICGLFPSPLAWDSQEPSRRSQDAKLEDWGPFFDEASRARPPPFVFRTFVPRAPGFRASVFFVFCLFSR